MAKLNVVQALEKAFPHEEPEWDTRIERCPVWFCGDTIMCATESIAEKLADFIDEVEGDRVAHTGYYDPFEDAENGETDECSGWYYVDFD